MFKVRKKPKKRNSKKALKSFQITNYTVNKFTH